MDIAEFKKLPIMGILRGIKEEDIDPLAEAVISSGLKTIEITMNTPDAAGLIRRMRKTASGQLTIGAGTVLNKNDAKSALDAGATFIVLPACIDEVVDFCVENRIPVFPGALTPTEIYHAARRGATMVKVFPAKFFGPGYLKEIKGPFNDISLLACGGVDEENIGTFFSHRADAVAFGASIFKPDLIARKDFSAIGAAVERLISAWRKA